MISSCVSLTLCLIYKLNINIFTYVQEKLQCKVWYGMHVSMRIKYTTEKKEIKKQRKGNIIKDSAISRDTTNTI